MEQTVPVLREAIETLNTAYNECPDPDIGDEIWSVIAEVQRIIRHFEEA